MSRLICVFLIVYLQNGIFGGVIKPKEDYMPSFTVPPQPDMKKDSGDQKSEDYMPSFTLPPQGNDGDNVIVPPKPEDKMDDSDQKSKDYMPSFTVPPPENDGDKVPDLPSFTVPPSKDDGDKVPDLPSFTVPPPKPGMDDGDKTEDKDSMAGTGDEDVVIDMEVIDDEDVEEDDGVDMYGPPPIPSDDEGEDDDGDEDDEDDEDDDDDDDDDGVKPWGWNDESTGPNYYKGEKSGSKIEIEARLALPVQVGDSFGADSFSSESCLRIALEDVNLQDVASVVHYEIYRRNVSTSPEPHLIKLDYTPFRFPFGYKVSAVLNRNWCGQGNNDEWVRDGDFLTTANFGIKTTNEKNKFIADVVLEEYEDTDDK